MKSIWVFCEESPDPDLITIGACDVNELPSIEPFTYCQNVEEYVDSCIDTILKQNIFLKIRNIVGDNDTEEGETNTKKLDTTYDDGWIEKLDVEEWMLKHF